MKPPRRKITYRLYLTPRQLLATQEIAELHRQLYNAALQQRIEAYQRCRISLSFADQCKELTELRKQCPEYEALNAQSCQVTLKRVDLAFQNFFRRVKQGHQKAGFPRFKSRNRFKGFGYKSHGDGFKLDTEGKHGAVRITGIGRVRMRGKARTFGKVVTSEVFKKGENWYLSVTVECQPKRASGKKAMGIDWGVKTFATLADSDGSYQELDNPRYLRESAKKLKSLQQALARKKRGSQNREKARNQLAKQHRKLAHQRQNYAHQTSAAIVKQAALLSSEKLEVKKMTSHGGAHKKGLNREILNTSPSFWISCLKYKAEEAGIEWIEIPTRKVKPTQRCSGCGQVEKKQLSQRRHECTSCGLSLSRDQNSARVILNWALFGNATGKELSSCEETNRVSRKQETPSRTT